MKKLLAIVVLGFIWCNISFAEFLGSDKTVDYYLHKEEYTLHSTHFIDEGIHVYHLIAGGRKGPDIITCHYLIKNTKTYCYAP